MRSTRIYHPEVLNEGQSADLSPEASHHVAVVLRFGLGEQLTMFDGQNIEYRVEIIDLNKKKVRVMVIQKTQVSRESSLKLHLAQGIAKGERWTFSLQKAVELGVTDITPLWTQHVAYKWEKKLDDKKMQQWQDIIISACEQSGRTQIPTLHPMQRFEDFVQQCPSSNRFILQPLSGHHWRVLPWNAGMDATLLIGPEGGFNEAEYQQALKAGFRGLTLGPRILRTETAVVSALSLLQALYGDL